MKKMRKFVFVLLGVLIPTLTANCSNKKNVEKAVTAETAEVGETNESVIKVSMPPFKKFVEVSVEESALYKETDTKSPTLVSWSESDCESDFCEMIYQWSDQPGKEGFELDSDIRVGEGTFYPVLDEEKDFYKVGTLKRWCEIESAYIPKSEVKMVETAPIKADELEQNKELFYDRYRVLRDGKYKGVVLCDALSELSGERLSVGVLVDGVLLTPVVYEIDTYLNTEQQEGIYIREEEGTFNLSFNKSMVAAGEDEYDPRLDLNKLSDKQIAEIVETVIKKKPEVVSCMYLFPSLGTDFFYYKTK